MGISRYRYLHYDVFTDRRFRGNQLAVFPEAAGLPAETMQQIAREIGFAETTFVTAAERAGADVRMRIFTPGSELPMAGHPVVGSTFALARAGAIAPGRTDWTFGLNIGPTPVSLEWSGARLDFAWMTQRKPEFGRTFDDIGQCRGCAGFAGRGHSGDWIAGPGSVVRGSVRIRATRDKSRGRSCVAGCAVAEF